MVRKIIPPLMGHPPTTQELPAQTKQLMENSTRVLMASCYGGQSYRVDFFNQGENVGAVYIPKSASDPFIKELQDRKISIEISDGSGRRFL